MPEAITKFAINSSLGTKNFMPLDKLILSQKRLIASDDDYANIYPNVAHLETPPYETKEIELLSITMIGIGSFKLSFSYKLNLPMGADLKICVFKNGVEINSSDDKVGSGSSGVWYTANPTRVYTFEDGDVYNFILRHTNANNAYMGIDVSNLTLKGEVIENFFTIQEE